MCGASQGAKMAMRMMSASSASPRMAILLEKNSRAKRRQGVSALAGAGLSLTMTVELVEVQ